MAGESKRRSSGTQGIPGLVIPPTPDGPESSEAERREISGFYTFGEDEGPEPTPPPEPVTDASIPVFARVGVRLAVEFLPSVRVI